MQSLSKPLLAASIALAFTLPSYALNTVAINPTSDGSLYVCDGCNVVSDGAYVLASGYIQGAIKFSSTPISEPIGKALLSLNPYGLPLFGQEVSVYGYGTSIAQLDISDANAGTLLGVLTLPANLGFGQDAFFDVTNFVRTTQAPFLGFNLALQAPTCLVLLSTTTGTPLNC